MLDFSRQPVVGVDPARWRAAGLAGRELLDKVISTEGVGAPLSWWLSSPASRNPFVSPLFHRLRVYCYVKADMAHERALSRQTIIVDSNALGRLLTSLYSQVDEHGEVPRIKVVRKSRLRAFVLPFFHATNALIRIAILGIAHRRDDSFRRIDTVIDTFILGGWSGEDRYYPGFWERIPVNRVKSVRFVPEILARSPLELLRIRRRLSALADRFLLKERVLDLGDYVFALRKSFVVPSIQAREPVLEGGVRELIDEELRDRIGFDHTLRAWLNIRFFRKLRARHVPIVRSIDWFENQTVDKGWNAGVVAAYPDAVTIGYQAFSDVPDYFCMFPITAEFKAGVLPRKLALIGERYASSRTKSCPEIDVFLAPAFRFAHVWTRSPVPLHECRDVLVTLPIDRDVGMQLLSRVLEVEQEFWDRRHLRVSVKLHPAVRIPTAELASMCDQRGLGIELAPFNQAIDHTRLLIGTMSNTCMEAAIKGIPVALFVTDAGDFNTIPSDFPRRRVANFRSGGELRAIVDNLLVASVAAGERDEDEFATLRRTYFVPITEDAVAALVGIQPSIHGVEAAQNER